MSKIPFARRNINVKHLSEADFEAKYHNRVRCARQKMVTLPNGEKVARSFPGKTLRDHRSGAWGNRFAHKNKPIRCTSSHRQMGQDNRGPEFWQG